MRLETSLVFGSLASSQYEDNEMGVLLRDGLGFNLGFYAFSRRDRMVAYGELLLRRDLLNVSPGWVWNLRTVRSGPQLTVSKTLVYARHLSD